MSSDSPWRRALDRVSRRPPLDAADLLVVPRLAAGTLPAGPLGEPGTATQVHERELGDPGRTRAVRQLRRELATLKTDRFGPGAL